MSEMLHPKKPVIIVDDEPQILISYDTALRMSGTNHIISCGDSRRFLETLAINGAQVILLDLMMPHVSGDALLPQITRDYPHIPVIIITGKDETETAVSCMKHGAFDFLVKPVDRDRLITTVKQAIAFSELHQENTALRDHLLTGDLKNPSIFADIVTNTPAMRAIFQYVEAIAPSSQPVLITGETGAGKEVLAHAIHRASGLDGPFIPISIAGMSDDQFSEVIFGHADAGPLEPGEDSLLRKASGGVLFLDEIGDLGSVAQLKLLRLLQDSEFSHGGRSSGEARIVVATSRDLKTLQEEGTFRKDLYYRLRAHWIHVPALRDRMDDLPLLLDFFLEEAAKEMGKKKPRPPKELLTLLSAHHFPGNIRELRTMVFDAMNCHRSMMLSMDVFKKHLFEKGKSHHAPVMGGGEDDVTVRFGPKLPKMNEMKQRLIEEAMNRTGGNKTLAASILGISRQAISWREKNDK